VHIAISENKEGLKSKMKKKTLGSMLKDRREFLRLTQRELAAKLGVKASHVAYLENGRRRPSLSLLRRLSTVMGLDSETIFLLAHPEARELITPRDGIPARRPENAWRNFLKDRSLIARHQIKPSELRVLKQVNLLGRVTSPRHFLFILNSIRQAVEQE
jgi:transcriptional regulator with XRE-family HTH domain